MNAGDDSKAGARLAVVRFPPPTDSGGAGQGSKRVDLLVNLFNSYNRSLKLFLRNLLGSEQTAEEIAQETYLRLLNTPDIESCEHPRAYLFRTARNLATDYLRRRGRGLRIIDGNVPVDQVDIPSVSPSPEEVTTYQQTKQRLDDALRELPLTTRRVFYYRRYQRWSIAQISAQMELTERMVYKHMETALKHLASRLGQPGGPTG